MYIFALFGLFIFFIGGAIPASQGAHYEFLFTSLGFPLSMICWFSCQSLMYRCEWHGFIDILYDRWSLRPLFLFLSLAGAIGLVFSFVPTSSKAHGSPFFHICDTPVYLSVWLLYLHYLGGVDLVNNLSLSGLPLADNEINTQSCTRYLCI